jgi:hypothetical protein
LRAAQSSSLGRFARSVLANLPDVVNSLDQALLVGSIFKGEWSHASVVIEMQAVFATVLVSDLVPGNETAPYSDSQRNCAATQIAAFGADKETLATVASASRHLEEQAVNRCDSVLKVKLGTIN